MKDFYSSTVSTRQPVATKPLYQFDNYTSASGKPALAVRIDIRDMAKLYAIHPEQRDTYESDWCTTGGFMATPNPYVPDRIHNADDALNALDRFEFPQDIKQQANRASRRLIGTFEQVAKLTSRKDLTSGKLDRRKLPAIARHTASNTYDANVIRPYRRTEPRPVKVPTVAIVASAGNVEIWQDADYIPRILALTLSVLWACEAAGLQSYAALTSGHCRLGSFQKVKEAIEAVMLAEPARAISPRTFGVAFQRDLWRYGNMTVQAADYTGSEVLANLQDDKFRARKIGYSFPSRSGGNAVQFAREVLQADIVIAIGNITDKQQADISLDTKFTVDQAVEEIVKQAAKL